MTKQELINKIHSKHKDELTKKLVGELVDETFGLIAKTVKKEKRFSYPHFGTWTLRERKARMGRNPQTNEVIKIKKSKTIGFRPAKSLKEKL